MRCGKYISILKARTQLKGAAQSDMHKLLRMKMIISYADITLALHDLLTPARSLTASGLSKLVVKSHDGIGCSTSSSVFLSPHSSITAGMAIFSGVKIDSIQ